MKRFTKETLPDTDVAPEKPDVDVWKSSFSKEFLHELRNTARIEQLEAGQADLRQNVTQVYQILNDLVSSQWSATKSQFRTQRLSWQEVAQKIDVLRGFEKELSLWERAELATQPIISALETFTLPYREKLSTVARLLDDLEEDFSDIARRITRCAVLEEELANLETSLEEDETEYLAWCVSLIRDVLDYNYAEDLTESHLALLKKAINLVHDKVSDCNKEDYQNLHKEFLQTGLALLPTTQKAIDKYGD